MFKLYDQTAGVTFLLMQATNHKVEVKVLGLFFFFF